MREPAISDRRNAKRPATSVLATQGRENLNRAEDNAYAAERAVTAQRLRSALTLLGIAVGITAVILLTSIGEGIHRFVLAEFTQFGTNIASISPGKVKTSGPAPTGIPSSVRPITLEDTTHIARLAQIDGVSPMVWGNSEVGANGRLRRVSVNGVGADMLRVYRMGLRTGQFLPAEDLENARAFVVLGATLKNELFGADNALGQRVRIGAAQFRVIGVLESKGQFLGVDLDDAAYVPVARAMELFNREGMMKVDVSYREGTPAASVVKEAKREAFYARSSAAWSANSRARNCRLSRVTNQARQPPARNTATNIPAR